MRTARSFSSKLIRGMALLLLAAITAGPAILANGHHGQHMTKPFEGVKANKGFATHSKQGRVHMLTLSEDFVVPDTPAPHWQVVDSKGNTFLLKRLKIKEDKYNQTIALPSYIHDVAKVQIWCAFAETLLGEAAFEKPVK